MHTISELTFLDGYAFYLDGDTVETYGKLVSFEKDKRVVDLMYTQRQFTPGDGLRAFQVQQRVYPFLIKCCELILHGFAKAGTLYKAPSNLENNSDATSGMANLNLTSESAPTVGESGILPTLANITAEAPYRLPAVLDLNRIRSIIERKREAADDHFWTLREDPGYFADAIMDWSEHRNDRLLDTNGNPHPTGPHTIDFWERVVRNVIANAYSAFMNWDILLRHVDRLLILQDRYKDEISYEKPLPREYLIAILKFRQL